jgi:hypothetical protein
MTAAVLGLAVPRPRQTSRVRLGRLWPRWSAIWRAESPASSSRVTTVLRSVCEVTQSKPARPRASRRSPLVLLVSRSRPYGLEETTGSSSATVRVARRWSSTSTRLRWVQLPGHGVRTRATRRTAQHRRDPAHSR